VKPIPDLQLQQESLKAGDAYLKAKVKNLDLQERTAALNGASKGFYMGVRWAEKHYGVSEISNNDVPKG
jgi:hypothetical protein